jgi:hypothetical protein
MFIAGAPIHAGDLEVIDIGVQAEAEFIYMAHPEGRNPSMKLKALAEHLRAVFGAPPCWERQVRYSAFRSK